MLEAKPEHLIGDRAYDSDGLDDDLKQNGVDVIAPHRHLVRWKYYATNFLFMITL